MEVSFYLKRANSPQKTSIYARIFYNSHEMKYYFSESILPIYWNKDAKRARETKKFPEYNELNTRLNNVESGIKNTIRKFLNDNTGQYPSPSTLKSLLDISIRNGGNVEKITFMSFFNSFIKSSEDGTRLTKKGKPIAYGTIKTYYTTKVILENYQQHAKKKLDFETIDMSFYNDFTKYLTLTVNQSTNYIGKHIKVIKTVLHEATEQGINTNVSFKGRGFTTVSEEANTIFLTEHELKEIAALDLTENPGQDRTRDLFLIGCYTGLRFSDLSTLRPEQIIKGMITITQIKTGDKVVIPVHETVYKIMSKYGGELPTAKSNQKTNQTLKDIAKKCKSLKMKISLTYTKGGKSVTKGSNPETENESPEKWQFVTTHTARRSFATNEYLAETPSLTIMAITGHKTEKAFLKYIKVTPDDHAKILGTIWENRKEKQSNKIAI